MEILAKKSPNHSKLTPLDGLRLGPRDGCFVGSLVGSTVGLLVGSTVGLLVGSRVSPRASGAGVTGDLTGWSDGTSVGENHPVNFSSGSSMGFVVGFRTGLFVGGKVVSPSASCSVGSLEWRKAVPSVAAYWRGTNGLESKTSFSPLWKSSSREKIPMATSPPIIWWMPATRFRREAGSEDDAWRVRSDAGGGGGGAALSRVAV